MHVDQIATDDSILAELGRRVETHRAGRNLTQVEFAHRAGVARSTVQRIERGDSIQLSSLVKILRALGRLDALDYVLPSRVRSPVAEFECERARRQRVRHKGGHRKPGPVYREGPASRPWAWGDEGDPE